MFSASAMAALFALQGSGPSITVHIDQRGHPISPTFFGLMTEEINHSYDGGLYGELIQNRDFRDNAEKPLHWTLSGDGTMSIESGSIPGTALDKYLKVESTSGSASLSNHGFWGVPIKPNTRYSGSLFASESGLTGPISISLESSDGNTTYATAVVPVDSRWRKRRFNLSTQAVGANKDGRVVIRTKGPGTLNITQVSLFPPTFHGRPNGNRVDLMQKLIDMKPSFLRFPGGNFLEGNSFMERFDWKKTVGRIEDRPGHQGPWGYRSSDGMGILEFLEWCEDMKAQPVLAVFAGYALNREKVSSGAQYESFIQDALDEIEYVTGGPNTKWGAQRVRDGHAKPFPLTYVEIGNEDWNGTDYDKRFTGFFDAIRAKYPHLKLIATNKVQSRKPDLVDDHYYRKATEMMSDSGHYDSSDRNGSKTFVGEWASTDNTPWKVVPANPTPTFHEALGDAAWLTGLERNSDQVVMQCYAPLLSNVNEKATQWGVNLIGYDSLNSFGSPSYYVQTMFAQYTGTETIPVDLFGSSFNTTLFLSTSKQAQMNYMKIVNVGASVESLDVTVAGVKDFSTTAEGLILSGDPTAKNSLEMPFSVSPKSVQIRIKSSHFQQQIPAHSVVVFKFKSS